MACFDLKSNLSTECFEIIIQSLAEALFIVDLEGSIRYCNQAMETITGLKQAELIGKKCKDIMECACFSMKQCELFRTGVFNNVECKAKTLNNQTITLLKNGRQLYNREGAIIGFVETMSNISALRKAEYRLAQLEETIRERNQFQNIISKSDRMKNIFEMIDLAADSSATVLIFGETGTGKELTAIAIHERSKRNQGPLIKVNCSALPENLLESELFGHVKGAFTGAIKDKIGRFEMADGGTLFLDEIGDISALIQMKLLRFLQEREYERVGESVTRKADVRVIAATNRDLFSMVQSNQFREDLYYRLKVFPILLPPLRERKEDIGLLVNYFIQKFNIETGKSIAGLSHDAALILMDYPWPGNIRELENTIEHAFVICKGNEIQIFDLPLEIRKAQQIDISSPSTLMPFRPMKNHEITRDELYILLNSHKWNKAEVSRHLGIDRSTLWRKMKKLGISMHKEPYLIEK